MLWPLHMQVCLRFSLTYYFEFLASLEISVRLKNFFIEIKFVSFILSLKKGINK